MNVLEKVLEEIEEYEKRKCSGESLSAFESGIGRACLEAKEIIRSHMDDIPDTNVGGDNDTEEKIRVHIAECLHRIDNIRSFVGSKERVNNDEKCIRNIEILKTSIAALEEYLRLKKKNGNDSWIPVSERLPEEHDSIFARFKGTDKWNKAMFEKISDEVNATIEYEDGSRKTTTSYTLDGVWKIEKEQRIVKQKVIAWQPLPETYKGGE